MRIRGTRPAGARAGPAPPGYTAWMDDSRQVTRIVALTVLLRGSRVLVTRRRPGEHLEGMWEFPGGKVREGERADEAARRELSEETGLAIGRADLEPLTFVHHDYGDRRVLLLAFIARTAPRRGRPPAGSTRAPGTPRGASRDRETRWVPLENLQSLAMPEANRRIVERAMMHPAAGVMRPAASIE